MTTQQKPDTSRERLAELALMLEQRALEYRAAPYHYHSRDESLDKGIAAILRILASPPPVHQNIPGGDPCPTCGFRIVKKDRPPFTFEEEASPSSSPVEGLETTAELENAGKVAKKADP